jgi:hypothetical protein
MTSARHQHSDPARAKLVQQWADLLELLQTGVEAVATSAEDMAQELPRELVTPVNRELQQRGSSLRVPRRRLRTAAGPRPGGPHAPTAHAAALHRCG